jgi:hypothetical protein
MAFAFDQEDPGPPGGDNDNAMGGAPPPGAGNGGGGAPPGGGPILAMLGRQQMGSPITAPGPGNMAEGMKLVTTAHGLLTQALQMFPAGTPQWKDIHKSLGSIGKHMAQSAPEAGAQQTHLGDLLKSVVRNALLQKIMSSRNQGQPGAGKHGGMEPDSPMAGIPTPSAPLPGA